MVKQQLMNDMIKIVAYDGKTYCVIMEWGAEAAWRSGPLEVSLPHRHWCQGSNSCDLQRMMQGGRYVDDSDKRSRGRCSWIARKSKQQGFLLKGREGMVLKWDWGVRRQLTPLPCDQMYAWALEKLASMYECYKGAVSPRSHWRKGAGRKSISGWVVENF